MRGQRRWLFCRTCGRPTWTFDHDHISTECQQCAQREQDIADTSDFEDTFWAMADRPIGIDDETCEPGGQPRLYTKKLLSL